MASFYGTEAADVVDTVNRTPSSNIEAYFAYGRGGDDRIWGGSLDDFLFGDAGNDRLYGRGGADNLTGGGGNDLLDGGEGDDFLFEQTGNDTLQGGAGNDRMWGCVGNDIYVHNPGDGLDTINDNKTATGSVGGGGTDTLRFGYVSTEVAFLTSGSNNNLYVTTHADMADGLMDAGVVIEDFFLGGNNDIEQIQCLNGTFLL